MRPNCASCAYYDIEIETCAHAYGKLAGIHLNESLANAEHDCKQFSEAEYRATPKGLLWLALRQADVDVTDEEFNLIWDNFSESMERSGYVKTESNEKENE